MNNNVKRKKIIILRSEGSGAGAALLGAVARRLDPLLGGRLAVAPPLETTGVYLVIFQNDGTGFTYRSWINFKIPSQRR